MERRYYKQTPESMMWSAVLALLVKDAHEAFKRGHTSVVKSLRRQSDTEHIAWMCDVCHVSHDKLLKHFDELIRRIS